MTAKLKKRRLLTRTFMTFMDNDLTTSAAAISYFSMLALFPSLLFLLAIGNRIIGPERVERYILTQALNFFPGAYTFLRKNLESITDLSTGVIISCSIAMLWAATWIFTV